MNRFIRGFALGAVAGAAGLAVFWDAGLRRHPETRTTGIPVPERVGRWVDTPCDLRHTAGDEGVWWRADRVEIKTGRFSDELWKRFQAAGPAGMVHGRTVTTPAGPPGSWAIFHQHWVPDVDDPRAGLPVR